MLDPFHLQMANKISKLKDTVKITQDVNKKDICWYGTQWLHKILAFTFKTTKQKQLLL